MPNQADTGGGSSWDGPSFIELLERVFRDLGGDMLRWQMNATSPQAAMDLVVQQYQCGVLYPDRSDPAYADLVSALRSAACMLRSAPESLDQNTVTAFLKTITCEWIDLGGFPGDLGC